MNERSFCWSALRALAHTARKHRSACRSWPGASAPSAPFHASLRSATATAFIVRASPVAGRSPRVVFFPARCFLALRSLAHWPRLEYFGRWPCREKLNKITFEFWIIPGRAMLKRGFPTRPVRKLPQAHYSALASKIPILYNFSLRNIPHGVENAYAFPTRLLNEKRAQRAHRALRALHSFYL